LTNFPLVAVKVPSQNSRETLSVRGARSRLKAFRGRARPGDDITFAVIKLVAMPATQVMARSKDAKPGVDA
jgi:hypothetical protein